MVHRRKGQPTLKELKSDLDDLQDAYLVMENTGCDTLGDLSEAIDDTLMEIKERKRK